jgi:hypothetical protein
MGESQYHARLATRVFEDGPLAYTAWIDWLSMHPSAKRPSDLHPPGTHVLAAAVLFIERLFSNGSSSLFYCAPIMHCFLLLLMYVHNTFSWQALCHNFAQHVRHDAQAVPLAGPGARLRLSRCRPTRAAKGFISRFIDARRLRARRCGRCMRRLFAPHGHAHCSKCRFCHSGAARCSFDL